MVIGTGVPPIRDIFSRLKLAHFNGWVCIEEASGTGRTGLTQAISRTRSLWNEVTEAKD